MGPPPRSGVERIGSGGGDEGVDVGVVQDDICKGFFDGVEDR